ncbi:RepA protein [Chickpea chlorosis virus-E]|uniref:Replication-associated protein n=1 Tax=Chickpea chlorosis virus-E TaxID=1162556 RepID=H9BAG7_9GEMI|nr:RepA protein [Chickpea chlorosis virus-E]AFD63043.1 RepA protein [Chickpea chlorosis virus-E]AGT45468.1 RepA [Chickpea chlorosis virus-E]
MPSSSTRQNNFRLQTKYVFLTYPHCSSTATSLRDFLWDKLSRFAIFFIAVATELHQDGTPHLHCLLQLDKRGDIRDPSFFDFEGNHPNIQPAKNSEQVLDYISKDGNVITRGDFRKHKVSPTKHDERWRNIIQTATTKEEYLGMIRDQFPHEWATKLQWLEYSANKLFPDIEPPYENPFSPIDLQCHEEIQEWLNRDLYVVSVDAYTLIHPNINYQTATEDLIWMDHFTRNPNNSNTEGTPSTSADQLVPERPAGLAVSADTTTLTEEWTSPRTTLTPPTISSTTSPSSSAQTGSN